MNSLGQLRPELLQFQLLFGLTLRALKVAETILEPEEVLILKLLLLKAARTSCRLKPWGKALLS